MFHPPAAFRALFEAAQMFHCLFIYFKGCQKSLFFTYFFSLLKQCQKYHISHTCSKPGAQGGLPYLRALSVSCAGAGMMYTGNVGEEQPSIKGQLFKPCCEPNLERTEVWKQLEETLGAKCPNSRCCEAANKLTAQFFKSCPGSPVSVLHG